MAEISSKWIESGAVGADQIEDGAVTTVKIADDNVTIEKINLTADASSANEPVRKSQYDTGLGLKEDAANKNIANGYCGLDATGKVAAAQLPSYVDDVEEYANLAGFPVTGETGKIYVALDTNKTYRWSGTVYIEISPSEVNSVNGNTGVVVLDTDDISEGATNKYYAESLFNTSFSGKSTTDLSEGSNLYYTDARFDTRLAAKSTTDLGEGANLYFTDGRAKTAAVVNSTAGSETDQAASVASMKSYVQAEVGAAAGSSQGRQVVTLVAGDITNGYYDLAEEVLTNSLQVHPVGGPLQEPAVDFTESLQGGVTRVTFAGDLASKLEAGDKVIFYYEY